MRALWASVVLQAVSDLEDAAYSSVIWNQAYSFFTATGEWATSRQAIADCLDVHINDIERLGRKTIDARAARDRGRPGSKPPPPPPPPVPHAAAPTPAGAMEGAPLHPIRIDHKQLRPSRDRNWWISQFLAKSAAGASA